MNEPNWTDKIKSYAGNSDDGPTMWLQHNGNVICVRCRYNETYELGSGDGDESRYTVRQYEIHDIEKGTYVYPLEEDFQEFLSSFWNNKNN